MDSLQHQFYLKNVYESDIGPSVYEKNKIAGDRHSGFWIVSICSEKGQVKAGNRQNYEQCSHVQ